MAITKRMGEIYKEYESGVPPEILAIRYNLSKNTILKKIKKVQISLEQPKNVTPQSINHTKSKRHVSLIWNKENIKEGIDRYFTDNGRMPTARDFDETVYLPSARQIQRAYGGLVALRTSLGYAETDFTKGDLRAAIAVSANKRGLSAEDYFEPLLVEKFGEPFVHVQKRYYKGSKCRYDFLIYAKDIVFGIDIFTTDRVNYIEKNIRHKISRYKNAPKDLVIYFVLVGKDFTPEHVNVSASSISELKNHSNMIPMYELDFIELISKYSPLTTPNDFVGLEELES